MLCTIPFQHTLVQLDGDLDVSTRASMQRALAEVDCDVVVVDVTRVTFMDAGALGCLAALKKRLRASGRLGIVKIVTPNPRFHELFRITMLDTVFEIVDSAFVCAGEAERAA